jgi:hypothetical protein
MSFSFLPMLKILVAMATNRLKIWQILHINLISDNAKSTGNIFMKLEIWVDGSLEIMHVFFFSSYVENSGCYGNK